MGAFNLIREDDFFKGLSDAIIDQRFNGWAQAQILEFDAEIKRDYGMT